MLELNPKEGNSQKTHTFLKRSGTRPKKQNKDGGKKKVAQNNGLVGFNKGMTYADKKGKAPVKLCSRKNYIPPGGQSSLNLFNETNIPDPRELRKQNQLRPLSQQQPGRDYDSPPEYDCGYDKYHEGRARHNQNKHSHHQDHWNQLSPDQSRDRCNHTNEYSSHDQKNQQMTSRSSHQSFQQHNNSDIFGRSNQRVSSNTYANGASQNCGNVITERSSTRVHAPPGGASSFSLAHVEDIPSQQILPPIGNRSGGPSTQIPQDLNSNQGIGALIQRAKDAQMPNEFGEPLHNIHRTHRADQSSIPRMGNHSSGRPHRMEARRGAKHNPTKVPGLEHHYSDGQRQHFGNY